MNGISRMFASAIVRRLAYVIVAACLAFVGIGRAHAADIPGCPDQEGTCTKPEAAAQCLAWRPNPLPQGYSDTKCTPYEEPTPPTMGKFVNTYMVGGSGPFYGPNFWYRGGCPAPTVWNASLQRCFDPAECLDRNEGLGTDRDKPRISTQSSKCVAGCEFKMENVLSTEVINTQGGAKTVYRGVQQYTGLTCNVTPPAVEESPEEQKPIKPQECVAADGSLQTVCIKPNGEHCHTAPRTGLQVCWTPGETGEKQEGPIKQKRVPGPSEIPPNLQLPSGDTLGKTGPSVTTNTTNHSTNSTIITTTTNYTTTNGTNAGPTNSGEPSNGSGPSPPPGGRPQPGGPPGGTGGGGGGEGEGKGASGGGNCQTPPIVTGDPVLGMVATQTWATRCAVDAGNAAKVTGDIGNCAQPFSVEGTNANAVKLRAMRAQTCTNENAGDHTGQPGNPADAFQQGTEQGTEGLDMQGFGWGSTCPNIPEVDVFGTNISLDPTGKVCDWISLGGYLVLIFAGIACLRIIGSA